MPLTRRAFTVAALSTAATAAGVVSLPRAALAAPNTAYVWAYFTESPSMQGANYGLHLAVSQDGWNWTPLNQNNPVVTPTAGTLGLRDPFLLRKQDGTAGLADAAWSSFRSYNFPAATSGTRTTRCASTRSARAPAARIGRTPPSG